MTLLILGVLMWSGIHLVPVLAIGTRESLRERLGNGPYRGIFSLLIVFSIVLIVLGWRSTPEIYLYVLPWPAKTVAFVLICISFILLGAAHHPSRIKRIIRNPMLTGIFIWAASHLLAYGTTRALALFGGLAAWALLEIVLINGRDGAFVKPPAAPLTAEVRGIVISGAILIVVLLLHPYFAGVSPFPR